MIAENDTKFLYLYFPCLSSTRKRIVLLYFGRDVRTHTISEVSVPPIVLIKMRAFRKVPCPRIQQANLPAYSPQPPVNAEPQAEKLWMPFFKVFVDSTRK